jgi:hypothetical protein
MAYWEELAWQRGVTMPQWHLPPTQGRMVAWLGKLGIDREQYLAWSGEKTLREFALRNPDWGLRPWVGLLLEHFCCP